MKGPAVEIDRAVRQVLAEQRAAPRRAAVAPPAPQPSNGAPVNVKVLTFDIVREQLGGRTDVVVAAGTIVTPLAREFLNDHGVTLRYQSVVVPADHHANAHGSPSLNIPWLYSQLQATGLAEAAIALLVRQGIELAPIAPADGVAETLGAAADAIALGRTLGALVFCGGAALMACAANKRTGVRAVAAQGPQQVARAVQTVACNLLAIEPAGRSLHELCNMLRAFCGAAQARQPSPQVHELLGTNESCASVK